MERQGDIRRLRISMCVRVLLIFLGLIGIQMVAYMIVVIGYMAVFFAREGSFSYDSLNAMAQDMMRQADLLLGISALSAMLSMLWCGILYRRSSWRVEKNDYRSVFSPANLGGIAAVGMGGCVCFSILLTVLSELIPSAFTRYSGLMDSMMSGTPALMYLYVLVIGPVSEELIFRGAVFDRFRYAFPVWAAILLQAVLFGVYHMNLIQGIYAFAIGAALGLICYKANSIFASMLAHCLFNATSYLLSPLAVLFVMAEWSFWVLFAAGCVAFALGVRYFIKKKREL